jgi:hypothetical protein
MRYKGCLFLFVIAIGVGCASICRAQETLRVPESAIRVHFQSDATTADLRLENTSGQNFSARIALELIDPHGIVHAQAERILSLSAGATKTQIVLPAIPASEKNQATTHLFLYRLRYSVTPSSADAPLFPPVTGIVSISEVTPQLFELHAATSEFVKAGNHYSLHVRAIHPVTSAPAQGVAVQGSLDIEEDKPVLTSRAVTDSRGYATLDFTLPKSLDPDRLEMTVTGTRDDFIATATARLSVPDQISASLSTDKPLYQPGQTLHMRLLAFGAENKAFAGQSLTFEMKDPENTLVYRAIKKTSRYGIAATDWQIPENLRLGTYEIGAEFDDPGLDMTYRANVKISRYELPTFSVAVKSDRDYYLPGQNASVEIRANYVYGQPVRRGHVRVVHETEREWDFREQKWKIAEEEAYEGETDSQGKFIAHVDLTEAHESVEDSSWTRFENSTYSAYFTDAVTGRTEERRFDLRVTRDPIHIYLIHSGPLDYPHEFYLSTDYADGTPAQCDVLIKWAPTESSKKRDPATKAGGQLLARVRTNRYGVAKVTGLRTPGVDQLGQFQFVLDAKDDRGSAGHRAENVWPSYSERELGIRVATNKTLYPQGEPINVELKSRVPETSVIVDAVHDARVVASQRIQLHHGHGSLVFPPNENFRNQVSVVAYAIGVHAERDPGEAELVSFRNVLFPKNHELNLDVRLAKASYVPGENVPADLRISGPDGERAPGAIGLVVVDRAVEERERTDSDLRRNAGFYGFRSMYYGEALQGFTVDDLDKLDLSKPLPEGFELVAEILMQSGSEEQPRFLEITSPHGAISDLFGNEINPQMNSIRAGLSRFYAHNGTYPRTEEALETFLSAEGIDFSALRDPWNAPYRIKFGVERSLDTLEIWTAGPDKKLGTSDDYIALTMQWEYFKPCTAAITRAVNDFHARTGEYIRDAATLNAELMAQGIDFNALRDPWGHAYQASFGARGNDFQVTVTSAGPDGIFTKDGEYSYDDFDVATIGINYFEETRNKIDHALSDNFNKTLEYPENIDQFRNILQKYGIEWDQLKDPWGHGYKVLFSQGLFYADDVTVKTVPNSLGDSLHHTTTVPVTRIVEWIHIRSEGPGGKENSPRDFEAAGFSHTLVKQSAGDRSPVTLFNQPVLEAGMGAITGTVFDADQKAIVGAQVTAKNSATDEIFMGITDDAGVYLFRNIPPGHYVLAFSAVNFKSSIITNVSVFAANTTTVDGRLEVGSTTMTVEVTSGQVQLATLNSTSAMISSKEVPGTPKASQSAPLISTPRLRQYFPETLFWQPELITDSAGRAHLSIPLADNITTWKLSAIASTEKGEIGSAEKDIRAFQPFFVEHDPPRFLTEGDEIDLPVVLRNYLNHTSRVNVAMMPESWFVPLSPASAKSEVPAGDAATEIFRFRAASPVKNAKQRVTATGAGAGPGDAIERAVTVRPNGEERSETKSQVFDDNASLDLQIPAQALPGSLEGELKIYPNLNAHVLESIETILERPYGCAEQTISSTYPNILLLKYLKNAKNESSPLAPRARRYVQQGYDRLLSYRGEHGGFSYWGKGDPDLALTAYAMRFLLDASEFIEIDDSIVDEQLTWILRNKESDGRWIASDWYLKEDPRQTLILTAYIARTIADMKFRGSLSTSDKELEPSAAQALKNALDYLGPKVAETDEPYLIASYALALAGSDKDSRLSASLDRLRKLEHREADSSYWMLEANTPFFGWGLAGRIETTALVLQVLKKGATNSNLDADRELLSRGLLFLLKNQDRYGIWYSTQATINVLDALRVLTLRDDGASGVPSASSGHSSRAEILVDGRVVQSIDLPPPNEIVAPISVDISKSLSPGNHHVEIRRVAGSTPASLQEITTYYTPWAGTIGSEAYEHAEKVPDALQLSVNFDKSSAKIGEKIQCTVKAERIGFRGYGMMLAEIGLPPGAEVDRESLDRDMKDSGWDIDQYDVLPDRLVVYLWPHAGGTKFAFTFKVRYGVKALTTPSILYDYYNPEARATVTPTLFTVRK